MREYEIFEAEAPPVVFGQMKKIDADLSGYAEMAITTWESTNWTGGRLEKAIEANDATAQELERLFAPVRALLPPTVTLYRGIIIDSSYEGWKKGILTSWTTDRRTAELFAGLRYGKKWTSLLKPTTSEHLIARMVDQYERTGFLKYQNRYYVRNKEHPEYYNIYDDLAADLQSDNADAVEHNDRLNSRAKVFCEEIPREKIVWVTNNLNCKEFIVRL